MSATSGLHRRQAAAAAKIRSGAGGAPHPDIDSPPRPRPILQYLAFGLIFFLICLQFRSATHFRDPSDPSRSWIPIDPNRSTPIDIKTRSFGEGGGQMRIFSWTDCLDLQMLAVLANSTLSSSSYRENIYFHFLVPENEDAKRSYYKLKVFFPDSNLEIVGHQEVKKILMTPGRKPLGALLKDIAPLVIPTISPLSKRILYVSPNTIMKGNVAELFDIDLGPYAIATTEDCSKRLGNYVSIDVINAIQRTAAKPWIFDKPYDMESCLPDLSILLIEVTKFKQDIVDAILWWTNVLNLTIESDQINAAIALAIYDKYLKLPGSWKPHSASSKSEDEIKVHKYDGPSRMCLNAKDDHQDYNQGDMWLHYVPPNSESILSHQN